MYHYSTSFISSCYCIILHQCIASWYFTMLLHHITPWYCTMLQQNRIKQVQNRATNVPQNEAQTGYEPQAPQLRYSWGTEYSPPLDGDKLTDFWIDFDEKLNTPIFLVCLIYRWGKGPKFKNKYRISLLFSLIVHQMWRS